MIRKTLVIILGILSNLAFSQTRLEIQGTAFGVKDGTELIIRRSQPKFIEPVFVKTKVVVKNERFNFSTIQEGPELYYIEMLKEGNFFFLDNGKVEIKIPNGSIRAAVLSNNIANEDLKKFQDGKDSLAIKKYSKALRAQDAFILSKSNDETAHQNIRAQVAVAKKEYEQKKAEEGLRWIRTNPNSPINAYVLNYLWDIIPDSLAKSVYNKLPLSTRNNTWGRDLDHKINSLMVGAIAPDFEQTDTAGNLVKLSSFKGKYVLVEFWATWCVPCRLETPRLVKAKQQLGSGNFEIISISLDESADRKKWLDAIKTDKMDWVNISSLKGFKNLIALDYQVKAIPTNFLIDPNGKILAKNVKGQNLHNFVKKR